MLQSETEILKLQKLDKLLVKLENDLKKKKRDIDKTTIVSTTKKVFKFLKDS